MSQFALLGGWVYSSYSVNRSRSDICAPLRDWRPLWPETDFVLLFTIPPHFVPQKKPILLVADIIMGHCIQGLKPFFRPQSIVVVQLRNGQLLSEHTVAIQNLKQLCSVTNLDEHKSLHAHISLPFATM